MTPSTGSGQGYNGNGLRLILPSDGALDEPSRDFMKACSLGVKRPSSRRYTGFIPTIKGATVLFQRAADVTSKIEEASADLGAHTRQTFRLVTFPQLRSALVAGALLAFALSFDEIIVTTFTIGAGDETLPIWIFNNFSRPTQLPIVNVVAVFVILISIIPVYLAHRLTREESTAARGGAPVASGAVTAP